MRKIVTSSALAATATLALVGCLVGELPEDIEEGPVMLMGRGAVATYIPGVDPDGRPVGLVGDMIVDLDDTGDLREVEPGDEGFLAVAGVTDPQRLWPGGVVPYRVTPSLQNDYRIPNAIAHWESRTNLRFVPWSGEPAVVDFTDDHHKRVFLFRVEIENCFAQVGRMPQQSGRTAPVSTYVHISPRYCNSVDTVVHEIGHAIGLSHTHQREDRDQHIVVHKGNISWKHEANFTRLKGRWLQNGPDDDGVWFEPFKAIGEYDTGSFMHYGSYGFSKNGHPTMTRHDGSTFNHSGLITDRDAAAINQLYQNAPADYPPPPPDENP